jgi:hypothetical protein
MTRLHRLSIAVVILVAVTAVLGSPAAAQEYAHCKDFFTNSNINDRIDCLEAYFSASPAHFTFSGMPPGNGVALGGVLEQQNHFVSPYARSITPLITPGEPTRAVPPDFQKGSLWATDARLAVIGSYNGSWAATGTLTLIPGRYKEEYRKDSDGSQYVCHRFGFLCTKTVPAVHLEASHRSLQTVAFYGLGPRSPAVKYTFHQNDTYGSLAGNLPLTEWLNFSGAFEYRETELPPTTAANSVNGNFDSGTAPGLQTQPGFVHSQLALNSAPTFHIAPTINVDDDNRNGPLMVHYFILTLRNSGQYHWYAAQGQTSSSFQQVVFDGDEALQLGSAVNRLTYVSDAKGPFARLYYHTLAWACGNKEIDCNHREDVVLRVTHRCQYGTLDLRSHIVASRTGPASTVPFYLQPTVGGSDIDSRVSLRAFPDYRFRGPDSLALQTEYTVPIRDPLGLLLFYEAGTVGQAFSSLSLAHLRQDAGFGMTVSLQHHVVAQGYLGFGAGHGPTLNYNFAKLF